MRATSADYLHILQQLLPEGTAWPRDPAATLTRLLNAMADSLGRAHNRAVDLLAESDPRVATEMLTDWERVLGLPDDCTAALTLLLQERRDAAHAKLTSRGGQSRQFFIDLAAALGFTVTITEFRPFRVGISTVGDPVCSEDWRFHWQVNAPATTIRSFRTGSSTVGEPLRSWGNELLECALSQRKPAHTSNSYAYGA